MGAKNIGREKKMQKNFHAQHSQVDFTGLGSSTTTTLSGMKLKERLCEVW